MPDTLSRGASANLDLLRAIAVLLVLLNHLTRHYHIDRFDDVGLFGVLLFFVHTALVLMYSMQRSHLTGLALGPRPGFLELFSNIFLIQNLTCADSIIGPLWSLPLEVQMYVFLPFLFLWRKRSVAQLLMLWIGCGLLGHFVQTVPALGWLTVLLYVPNFLPGIIAFTLPERRLLPSYLWPVFILALTALFYWIPSRRVGAVACLLLGFGIPFFKEISLRPVAWAANRIATYSYGIYLGHSFFIWWALTEHNSCILFWLMWIIVPAATYHLFEHPAVEAGKQLAQRLSLPRKPTLVGVEQKAESAAASAVD